MTADNILSKKLCMLGSFAVGKTSLVSQFVHSIFSDAYQTTIGVKIDKKVVELGDRKLNLVLWDLHGEDEFQRLSVSFLKGQAGFLVVADGTRRSTLEKAIELQERTAAETDWAPFILLLNKADLADQWEIGDADIEALTQRGWTIQKTSAKTGEGVEEAFLALSKQLV